jgi:hypothetical protein
MRLASLLLLCVTVLCVTASANCKCDATYSPCREAASANVIFIGTVESVSPAFLDTWNESQKASLELLNREYERAQGDRAPAAFARLRDAYLKVFPDLPADHKKRVQSATSAGELGDLFYRILDQGKRVRLTVRTRYRNGDDDDDDAPAPKTIEIRTPFGECGIGFQAGETYLVYADSDEEAVDVTTTSCHRTRRLSEAGDDLAYLYFLKNSPKEAARIEAFVTSDSVQLKQRDREHYVDRIGAAVAGATVELADGAHRLRGVVNEYGRAVFDGLAEGQYTLTAWAPGYPAEKHAIAGPQRISLDERGCAIEVLLTRPIQ